MFTGIVSALGTITQVLKTHATSNSGVQVTIEAPCSIFSDLKPGDSVAIQGACMTVISFEKITEQQTSTLHQQKETIRKEKMRFIVDISSESLACTVGLDVLGPVNIEPALCVGDQLGGHWVSGHVDGVGEVIDMIPSGESRELCLRIPASLAGYVAAKGSLTVNGVSLTVNRVKDEEGREGETAHWTQCSINIIPHTLKHTTLQSLKAQDKVNLEVDLMARYMARFFEYHASGFSKMAPHA
jgi:riboflavin synthase